jgi:hypothetical protein
MPIRRDLRCLYPPHWRELSRRIRFERAGGRCQALRAPASGLAPLPAGRALVRRGSPHLAQSPGQALSLAGSDRGHRAAYHPRRTRRRAPRRQPREQPAAQPPLPLSALPRAARRALPHPPALAHLPPPLVRGRPVPRAVCRGHHAPGGCALRALRPKPSMLRRLEKLRRVTGNGELRAAYQAAVEGLDAVVYCLTLLRALESPKRARRRVQTAVIRSPPPIPKGTTPARAVAARISVARKRRFWL